MANESASGEQGVPINITTILALLTLLGGVLLVTHKLSSDRPVGTLSAPNEEISEQKVDTRLWEDPFSQVASKTETNKLVGLPLADVTSVTNRSGGTTSWGLAAPITSPAPPMTDGASTNLPASTNTSPPKGILVTNVANFHLLAVMVPGGPSSDERETRIRGRYAIVSALAESAYAPRHQAHIGIGKVNWPATRDLAAGIGEVLANPNVTPQSYSDRVRADTKASMLYAFEWYDRELFAPRTAGMPSNTEPVLLLWLDEDQFNDYPIPRLHLFLSQFLAGLPITNMNWWSNHPASLIGPGRSDTLKSIFAREFNSNKLSPGTNWATLTTNVSLFLATPRAIDEVLLREGEFREDAPRGEVLTRLQTMFKSPRNFAATDLDLTKAVLGELKLRGVDFTKTNEHHLVLIGGWDDYFGRMLTAAYAAELAVQQKSGVDRRTFLRNFQSGSREAPTNLHTFLYLSGLDGQGLSSDSKNVSGQKPEGKSDAGENSTKDKPARWIPDVNRAEGPAQFDYLGRLASRITDLNESLLRDGKGTVSAIGIGGGNIYDTLLILQALRSRFPETIFFVTDLDARFWDPKEWQWSRNLLVVSGYGVSLHEDFQRQTAPFRDSLQTAAFAAALAALGNTNVPEINRPFPVRLFEIGRNGPVDLRSTNDSFSPRLHPEITKWHSMGKWFRQKFRYLAIPGVLLFGALMAIAVSRTVRRLTIRHHQFLAEPLWLREEDIGGMEGFAEIARNLANLSAQPAGSEAPAKASTDEDLLRKHLGWLQHKVDLAINHAQAAMNESLQEQGAVSILAERDILRPFEFLTALRVRDSFLRKELPPSINLLLDAQDQSGAGMTALLEKVVESLREIIISADLAASPGLPDTARLSETEKASEPVRWRKNRLILAKAFPNSLRPPARLSDWLTRADDKEREALKDPELQHCLQLAMLEFLDSWNARLPLNPDAWTIPNPAAHTAVGSREGSQRERCPDILTGAQLDQFVKSRNLADKLIAKLLQNDFKQKAPDAVPMTKSLRSLNKAAAAARAVSTDLFSLCGLRWQWLVWIFIGALVLGFLMGSVNLLDAPYSLLDLSGASLWPSNWLYLFASLLGLLFISESYFQLRKAVFETTRRCRFGYRPKSEADESEQRGEWRGLSRLRDAIVRILHPSVNDPAAVVHANEAWRLYQQQGRGKLRFWRTIFLMVGYVLMVVSAYQLIFGRQYAPLLRYPSGTCYYYLVWTAFMLFLFLSFWTIDAAFLCRWFILRISGGPTLYSLATRQHFSRQRGQVPYHMLSEWIDVSVIAQITERVGLLIYFPAVMFLLLIVGNNSFLYYFPWPPAYYALMTCHFGVAAASVVILQRAAQQARERSAASLQEKLNQLKAGAVATEAQKKQHDIVETEALLTEIRSLKKGAFGGFWSNPVLGALLVPSGGTALIEIIRYLSK